MNILGIDFEEWFHPELIQRYIKTENREFKIINGLDKILEFLNDKNTFATFFMVGEILEKYPEALDKILSNGHEIAFHTMYHSRLDLMNSIEFTNELEIFSKLSNKKSKGFRAPTFSLNQKSSWAIDVLKKFNYLYDSSIVPAKSLMYGNSDAPRQPYKISSNLLYQNHENSKMIEFPLMVTKFLGKTIPSSGGFYLRTLPFKVIKDSIFKYQQKNIPSTFYIHSWEMTPEYMPRISLSTKDRFITYHNLDGVLNKMDFLLENFSFTSFERYIKNYF